MPSLHFHYSNAFRSWRLISLTNWAMAGEFYIRKEQAGMQTAIFSCQCIRRDCNLKSSLNAFCFKKSLALDLLPDTSFELKRLCNMRQRKLRNFPFECFILLDLEWCHLCAWAICACTRMPNGIMLRRCAGRIRICLAAESPFVLGGNKLIMNITFCLQRPISARKHHYLIL